MDVQIVGTKTKGKGLNAYTVYQIKLSPGRVIFERRYNDFLRLQAELEQICNDHGLKLPEFPEKTILRRYDNVVIEDRREKFLKLMKFALGLKIEDNNNNNNEGVMAAGDSSSNNNSGESGNKDSDDDNDDDDNGDDLDEAETMKKNPKVLMKQALLRWLGIGPKTSLAQDPVNVVRRKLEKITPPSDKRNELLSKKSKVLANRELLKSLYLDFDWEKTKNHYKEIARGGMVTQDKEASRGTVASLLQSTSEATTSGGEVEDDMPEYEDSMLLQRYNPRKNQKQQLRVKLVITEITNATSQKSLRKVLCPIVTTIGPYLDKTLPTFGCFHSALIIGPWYLEWNATSLCIPRTIMSRAALISCDLDSIRISRDKIDEVRDKVAEVICYWNTSKTYSNYAASDKKETEGNCQDFVDDILTTLDIDISSLFTGQLGKYLTKLRERGTCDLELPMDGSFREKFKVKESSKRFESHSELDQFVNALLDADPEFTVNHKEEWMLLKSFDRAFWLRHLRDDLNPIYKPLPLDYYDGSRMDSSSMGSTTACPFNNPVDTNSFVIDNL